MSEKKFWSRDEVMDLISRWKLLPELWDVKRKDYRNKAKKQKAIKELATAFETNEVEISRKLHNLRTQFHQEIRKLKKNGSKPSGSGTDDNSNSGWEFFKSLMFIRGSNVEATTTNNLETKILFQNIDLTQPENTKSQQIETDSDQDVQDPLHLRKKKKTTAKEKEEYLLVKALKVPDRLRDDFQVFGDFVASELRNLGCPEKQRQLKCMIQRAILEISESEITSYGLSVASMSSWNVRSLSPSSNVSNFKINSPEGESI